MTTALDDEKVIITAEEAESLLPAGDCIHNLVNLGSGLIVGCDYDRAQAVATLKNAPHIEIGGDNCKRMKHPIVVFRDGKRPLFFAADMAKVEAFETARAASATKAEGCT